MHSVAWSDDQAIFSTGGVHRLRLNRSRPPFLTCSGGFQLKLSLHYGIVHREVFELRLSGELTGTASLLYEYLTFNCDVKSGIVHRLNVAQVARALRCNRSTVFRAVARLHELALLSPDTDGNGNCLSGSLPHVKSASAARGRKSASLRDIKTPTPAEARAARVVHSPAPPVFTPPPDSRNGSEGTAKSRDIIAKMREESGI